MPPHDARRSNPSRQHGRPSGRAPSSPRGRAGSYFIVELLIRSRLNGPDRIAGQTAAQSTGKHCRAARARRRYIRGSMAGLRWRRIAADPVVDRVTSVWLASRRNRCWRTRRVAPAWRIEIHAAKRGLVSATAAKCSSKLVGVLCSARDAAATTASRVIAGIRFKTIRSVRSAIDADHRENDDGRRLGIGVDIFAAARAHLVWKSDDVAHCKFPLTAQVCASSRPPVRRLPPIKGLARLTVC